MTRSKTPNVHELLGRVRENAQIDSVIGVQGHLTAKFARMVTQDRISKSRNVKQNHHPIPIKEVSLTFLNSGIQSLGREYLAGKKCGYPA